MLATPTASCSSKFALGIAIFSLALFFLPKCSANPSFRRFSSHSRDSPPSTFQNVAADILSLFGGKQEAARVPHDEAREIKSCLRFLVAPDLDGFAGRQKDLKELRRELIEESAMVWWPPVPVMELARLAVDSGGDPGTIQRALDPTKLSIPDVEGGLKKAKCELTRTPTGHRFANKDLNSYFEFLFELIAKRAPFVGMNVSLSRYDLFHGHLFLANNSGRLGILFHAREYPAYQKERFPLNLGFCQTGSNVMYDDSMNLRNILWLAPLPSKVTKAWLAPGALVILDAYPEGIIYKKLVPEYVDFVRTIYEEAFGEAVVDVNYLKLDNTAPGERIFIC